MRWSRRSRASTFLLLLGRLDMPKAGVLKVETTRRACGEAAVWLRDGCAAPAPTLLTLVVAEQSTVHIDLARLLARKAKRVGEQGLVLELDRAHAAWLAARAPSAAPRVPVLGGLFVVDVGAFAQAPRAVRDLAEQCAAALRVRRGGHNAYSSKQRRGRIENYEQTRGTWKQSVSDQRARVWRRRDRLDAWIDRVHARGESLLTTSGSPPR